MTPENTFEEKLRRDVADDFWIENVEQRHRRGYPDINMLDLKSDDIALVELKVTYKSSHEYKLNDKVVIKSLKSHQINWLESRATVGGRDRRNVGMLLFIDPLTFYIKGKDVTMWRDNTPTMHDILTVAGLCFYERIQGDSLRAYMFTPDIFDNDIDAAKKLLRSHQ